MFRQTDTYIEKDSSVNEEVEKMRHAATSALLTRKDVIVVASVSCIYGIGSPENYAEMAVFVDREVPLDRDEFIYRLIDMQYDRNDYELERGSFRVRGDSVDVFPPYMDNLLHFEFFGDEVEEIVEVDRITGRRGHELCLDAHLACIALRDQSSQCREGPRIHFR